MSSPAAPGAASDPKRANTSEPTMDLEHEPHSVYPTWIIFGVWSFVVGLGTFISQALFLSAIPAACGTFVGLAAIFLVIGLLMLCGGVAALFLKAMQPKSNKTTRLHLCCRITLFVFTLLLSAVCILMMVVGGGVYTMKRTQAALELDFSGAAAAGNISSPVTIVRDSNGIPHITAETMNDAFFGQGFVTAQDRLFQLEAFRLFSQGRLSEVGGSSAVDVDKLTRALGIQQKAEILYSHIPAETIASLQSYVGGINLYIDKDGAMPPEFMFFSEALFTYHVPEPFTPLDIVTMMMFMQIYLSGNQGNEKMRWKMFNQAGMSREDVEGLRYADFTNFSSILSAADWSVTEAQAVSRRAAVAASEAAEALAYATTMPRFRDNQSLGSTTATYAGHGFEEQAATEGEVEKKDRADGNQQSQMWSQVLNDPKSYFAMAMVDEFRKSFFAVDTKGSNGWFLRHALSGSVTGGGDPHLSVQTPSSWYSVQMNVGGAVNDVYAGMSIPGLPGIMYGRNKNVMWSITISFGDLVDLYVMEPDQTNKNSRYMYHGQSLAYTTRTETIKVKSSDPVSFEVQESVLGPIIGELDGLTSHHKIALNFSAVLGDYQTELDTVASFFSFFRSANVSEFKSKLEDLSAPALSFTAGDTSGGLLYMANGLLPIRRPGHTGKWPVLGDGTYDHLGFVPKTELAHKLDLDATKDGYVFSANHRITPDGYPYDLAFDYVMSYRGDRIKSIIENVTSTAQWTTFDFHKSLQTDIRSNVWMDHLKPTFLAHGAAWTSLLDSTGTTNWNAMLAWDGQAAFNSNEAFYLEEWTLEVAKFPTKALEVLGWDIMRPLPLLERLALWPTAATNRMCAEKSGGTATNCLPWLAEQWNAVSARAPKSYGIEYGALVVEHQLFGGSILGCFTDRVVHKEGDGSSVSVNDFIPTSIDFSTMYKKQTSNFRHVMSTNWTDGYYFTMVAGQSAHMFSYYYDNQINDIGTNTYHFVEMSGSSSDGAKTQVLNL